MHLTTLEGEGGGRHPERNCLVSSAHQKFIPSEAHSKRVISPELLNAQAHDAKHVLLFATLRNCRDQSDLLIILLVPQPMSSTV